MNMNPYPLFMPPPLPNTTPIHINESEEAINNTTIQGPAPVAPIDLSQGSFAQLVESPDNNCVVNVVQYKTRIAHLPNCVTSYFTPEQRMDH